MSNARRIRQCLVFAASLGSLLVNVLRSTRTTFALQDFWSNGENLWESRKHPISLSPSLNHGENEEGGDHDDIHNSSVALLDLLPWEVQSVEQPHGPCIRPTGVDEFCCLGTTAKADMRDRYLCSHVTLQHIKETRQRAKQQSSPSCDVCRVVELLRKHNLTFAFLGDSTSHQVARGFVCELQRRQYSVSKTTLPTRHGDGFRNFQAHERFHISSPLWQNSTSTTVTIEILFQYKLPFSFREERDIATQQFDILVVNFGLHWNYFINRGDKITAKWNKKNYQPMLTEFFSQVLQAGRVQLLMHRESQATHFDAAGGDYSLARLKHERIDTTTCVPIVENKTAYPSGWREQAVRQAAIAANYTVIDHPGLPRITTSLSSPSSSIHKRELVILPYFDFTAAMWDQHPRFFNWKERSIDCLHFCYTPFLFQPIWTGIRLAMDRKGGDWQ